MGCNERNRILVTHQILKRISIGTRAFAQHVIAESEPPRLALRVLRCPPWGLLRLGAARRRNAEVFHLAPRRVGLVHRFGNGLAQHKLATQQLHGAQRGGDDRARAELGEKTGRRFAVGQKLLAHRDRRAGQARQRLVASAVKVGAAQLISRQRNRGGGIGHAQQGLGQAHQGQTLGAGNRVFLEQALHRPERRRVGAHRLHPGRGDLGDGSPIKRTTQRAQVLGNDFDFRAVGKRQAHGRLRSIETVAMVTALLLNYSPNILGFAVLYFMERAGLRPS